MMRRYELCLSKNTDREQPYTLTIRTDYDLYVNIWLSPSELTTLIKDIADMEKSKGYASICRVFYYPDIQEENT